MSEANMSITNDMDVIDSRDIIDRLEEMEADLREQYESEETPLTFNEWLEDTKDEDIDDYLTLKEFAEKCEQYSSDWEYGVILIHEDYFHEYMDQMIEDCYGLPKDLPFWATITSDYIS